MDTPTDRLSWSPAPRAVQQAARPPATRDEQEAESRFAEKLEAKKETMDAQGGESLRGAAARLVRGQERFGPGGRDELLLKREEDGPDAGMAGLTQGEVRAAAPAPAPAEASRAPARPDPAIDRMAAAIAELSGKPGEQAARIDFPVGGLAEGALVTRDAQTGALSIRIVGLVNGLSDRRRSELESGLRLGLERRRIRASLQLDVRSPPLPVQGRLS